MYITAEFVLAQSQALASPEIDAERAAQLAMEVNTLLQKATPLIERYRDLYADPFAFLSALEELSIAQLPKEESHDGRQ